MIYRYLILLGFIAIIISCDDEYYGSNSNDPGTTSYYIETEVSLSPDGEYLCYINTDTVTFLYSGIGRMRVSQPLRARILAGTGFQCPTLNSDNSKIVYLDGGQINFYNIADLSDWQSSVTDSFGTVLYINENQVLAGRNDTLHLIDNDEGIIKDLPDYWDPTFLAVDTFVCMSSSGGLIYYIIKDNIEESDREVLYTFRLTTGLPRWPSIDIASGHIAYSIVYDSIAYICTAEAGEILPAGQSPAVIDSSFNARACIIDYNRILFTGPDGRIYQKDFHNTSEAIPFIHVEDDN